MSLSTQSPSFMQPIFFAFQEHITCRHFNHFRLQSPSAGSESVFPFISPYLTVPPPRPQPLLPAYELRPPLPAAPCTSPPPLESEGVRRSCRGGGGFRGRACKRGGEGGRWRLIGCTGRRAPPLAAAGTQTPLPAAPGPMREARLQRSGAAPGPVREAVPSPPNPPPPPSRHRHSGPGGAAAALAGLPRPDAAPGPAWGAAPNYPPCLCTATTALPGTPPLLPRQRQRLTGLAARLLRPDRRGVPCRPLPLARCRAARAALSRAQPLPGAPAQRPPPAALCASPPRLPLPAHVAPPESTTSCSAPAPQRLQQRAAHAAPHRHGTTSPPAARHLDAAHTDMPATIVWKCGGVGIFVLACTKVKFSTPTCLPAAASTV